jgi:hypothetical protein
MRRKPSSKSTETRRIFHEAALSRSRPLSKSAYEAEVAKVAHIQLISDRLRAEYYASEVGRVRLATDQALKDSIITPAPDGGGFGADEPA